MGERREASGTPREGGLQLLPPHMGEARPGHSHVPSLQLPGFLEECGWLRVVATGGLSVSCLAAAALSRSLSGNLETPCGVTFMECGVIFRSGLLDLLHLAHWLLLAQFYQTSS